MRRRRIGEPKYRIAVFELSQTASETVDYRKADPRWILNRCMFHLMA